MPPGACAATGGAGASAASVAQRRHPLDHSAAQPAPATASSSGTSLTPWTAAAAAAPPPPHAARLVTQQSAPTAHGRPRAAPPPPPHAATPAAAPSPIAESVPQQRPDLLRCASAPGGRGPAAAASRFYPPLALPPIKDTAADGVSDMEAGAAPKRPTPQAPGGGGNAGRPPPGAAAAAAAADAAAERAAPLCGGRWWRRNFEAVLGGAAGLALVVALVTCTFELGVMGSQTSVPLPVISGVTPGTPDAAVELPQLLPDFTANVTAQERGGEMDGGGGGGDEGAAKAGAAQAIAQEASPMQRATLGALLTFYDRTTGLFSKAGWWNNANTFEALIDYAMLSGSSDVITSMLRVAYDKNAVAHFFNNYYDDQGWWGITWARAYQLTGEAKYLVTAEKLFDNVAAGWTDACGGGVLWKKTNDFKATISTQLYIQLAMLLHNAEADEALRARYLAAAQQGWDFLSGSLLHEDGTLDDGLNGRCEAHTGIMYSYNQGVILGGLQQLAAATGRPELIDTARRIADAGLRTLTNEQGVLREKCEPECTSDGAQFKGIFVRYLYRLYRETGEPRYRDFLVANARSAWVAGRDPATNLVGVSWAGPYAHRAGQAAVTQTAALDLFNALQGVKMEG